MRWLHLSDLHIGRDNSLQSTAIKDLISAAEKFADHPFDFVIITGDLAFSGQTSEYIKLKELILEPLSRSQHFSNARWIIVPGNHDLDCNISHPIAWKSLGENRQNLFFSDTEKGKHLRSSRAAGFQGYENFVNENSLKSCLPQTKPAEIFPIKCEDGRCVYFVCITTAYFSDKDTSDKREAPAPIDSLRDVFHDIPAGHPVFVLGHHPFNWFSTDSANQFETLLIEKNAVYFHGHEHLIQAHFGPKGLCSLGFGAAYQGTPSQQSKPYYRNTFAICELSNSLEFQFFSWDTEYGSWVRETKLPATLKTGEAHNNGPSVVTIPTSHINGTDKRVLREQVAFKAKTKPRITSPIWIGGEEKQGWTRLLEQLGILKDVQETLAIGTSHVGSGYVQFIAKDSGSRHLIRAAPAPSAIITYEQVEQANTILDTESLDSCIIATFGEVADDAKSLAVRLKAKKPLTVLNGSDIAEKISGLDAIDVISRNGNFSPEEVTLTPLIIAEGLAVLIRDAVAGQWFSIISENGAVIKESDDLTYEVRDLFPELRSSSYSLGTTDHIPTSAIPYDEFSREEFLKRCTSLFDDVKYAGLAALGLQLPTNSLRTLYVPAAADVSGDQASTQSLQTAVDDFVEALDLDSDQKDQLEIQLRNYYGLGSTAEAGAARRLYQKYGSILVQGDPGSGKSCFSRYEILAYCQPPKQNGDWYKSHTPIFLPLADAARMAKDGIDLLDICVRFSASQKLEINRYHLDILLSQGKAALFFDGLDEVGSLEVRQSILKQIDDLIQRYQILGNRFVLTSRPAAVNNVEITENLVRLNLCGLTNEEIRTLATRIMTAEATGKLKPEPDEEGKQVVEQLISDCEVKPGIRRLARNPLLLTLLVIIYANSGPLAARRHLIYSQAVKTLVSVRHRGQRDRVLSEADLRHRLGMLALAVYRGSVSEIPSRQEVQRILSKQEKHLQDENQSKEEVDRFIQDVAETTGLVTIHTRSEEPTNDVISFMHHSFLEYYAAVGFLEEDHYSKNASSVALSPRWREVITLMFGLLSEQGDITPFLEEIAKETEVADQVTLSRLLLAIDCALECDVPPEKAQQYLATEIEKVLANGVGSGVAEVRELLAAKIQELLENTGSEAFRDMLIKGAKLDSGRLSAAYIEFLARMAALVESDPRIRNVISSAFEKSEPVIRIACISALQSIPSLRTEQNLNEVRHCLGKGTMAEKNAALQLLDSEPSLVQGFIDELVWLLDNKRSLVSSLAGRCLIIGGVFSKKDYEKRGLLDKALAKYMQSDRPQKSLAHRLEFSKEDLERLIFSTLPEEQQLGIRSLVVVEKAPNVIHDYLYSVLDKSKNHKVKSTCLDALAMNTNVIRISSLADADLVCKCAKDNFIDVRRSAIRALKHFPPLDSVKNTLLDRYLLLQSKKDLPEKVGVIRALASLGIRDRHIRDFLHQELTKTLTADVEGWGNRRKTITIRLLLASDQMGGTVKEHLSRIIYDATNSYKIPSEVKRLAIRTFGRTANPDIKNGERVIKLLGSQQRSERLSAYRAAGSFVEKCKGSVENIRMVYDVLLELRETLVMKWAIENKNLTDRIDFSGLRDIRVSLLAIEHALTSYDEFSLRMGIGDYAKQSLLGLETTNN
ncbi:MAG: metallophosphoesterase [Candidatus Sedimenticola sp. (ex Thyasira tokunagai)]